MDFVYLLSFLFIQLGWFDNRLFCPLTFVEEPVRSFPLFVSKLRCFAALCRHICGVVLGWAIQPFHFHFLALLIYLSNAVCNKLFPRQLRIGYPSQCSLRIGPHVYLLDFYYFTQCIVNVIPHVNVRVICNKFKHFHFALSLPIMQFLPNLQQFHWSL